jgi:hypothetical protein
MEPDMKERPWTHVKFAPWEGSGYASVQKRKSGVLPNNVRLLVLGESHYGVDNDRLDTTKFVVKCFLKGRENPRFFGAVTSTLASSYYGDLKDGEIQSVFNDIAFYNFVQESVGPGASTVPSREAFTSSYDAFFEILTNLAPTHVWVCGRRLWNNMPDFHFIDQGTIETGGKKAEKGKYLVDALKVHCLATQHPSRGYSWEAWRPAIMQYLQG